MGLSEQKHEREILQGASICRICNYPIIRGDGYYFATIRINGASEMAWVHDYCYELGQEYVAGEITQVEREVV